MMMNNILTCVNGLKRKLILYFYIGYTAVYAYTQ